MPPVAYLPRQQIKAAILPALLSLDFQMGNHDAETFEKQRKMLTLIGRFALRD
jgi:hypothetical protein